MKRCSKRQFSNACSISGIFRLQLVILRIVKIRLREPGCQGHVSHITRTSQQIRILKTGFLGYAEVFAVVLPMVPWLYLQKILTLTSNSRCETSGKGRNRDLQGFMSEISQKKLSKAHNLFAHLFVFAEMWFICP